MEKTGKVWYIYKYRFMGLILYAIYVLSYEINLVNHIGICNRSGMSYNGRGYVL